MKIIATIFGKTYTCHNKNAKKIILFLKYCKVTRQLCFSSTDNKKMNL